MFVPDAHSLLLSRVRRLTAKGKSDEAMAAMRRFLELERETTLSRGERNQEKQDNLLHLPILRPVS